MKFIFDLNHNLTLIRHRFAENVSLVFLCYQFLLDRFKDDDCNGSLSRAILETMSTFVTLTEDKMEKTHLAKVIPRYQKKGDAKSQYWLKKIAANVEAATKEAASKPKVPSDQKKSAALPNEAKNTSTSVKTTKPEAVTGIKRAASSVGEGAAQKKIATGAVKPNAGVETSKTNGLVKKPTTIGDTTKPTSTPAISTTSKKVVAKPSGFFSSLQSAQKKPGTSIADKAAVAIGKPVNGKSANANASASVAAKPAFSFAETMANLSKPKEEKPAPKPEKEKPTETAEQRAKRLRKEERRKLHVTFRKGEDLVQIRYFTHDPEEELHHDSSQTRDVSDVGGEGRMFKQQHQLMDIDDEDEAAEESENLIDFKPPTFVDFSVVPMEERERLYSPLGGGKLQAKSAERAVREKHENSTLIVVYTDPSQIPPNPREPADPYNGEQRGSLTKFGVPDNPKFLARGRSKRALQTQNRLPHVQAPQIGHMPPGFANPAPTPSQPALMPDLQQILANLRQSTSNQPASVNQPRTAPPAFAPPPFMAGQLPTNVQPQPPAPIPSAPIDISSILAAIQNSQQQSGQSVSQAPQYGPHGAVSMPNLGIQSQAFGNSGFNKAGNDDNDGDDVPAKHPFYKTKACKFWPKGLCQKGEACSYLHE